MKKGLLYTTGLYTIVFTIVISACSNSKPVAKHTAVPVVIAKIAPGMEDQILELVNNYRKTKGLSPLHYNFVIASVARDHTMDMATRKVAFGHAGFSGRFKYICSKVNGVTSVAENVAYGSQTAEEVVNEWLGSPGHRKNIEGNYRLTGIGVAREVQSRLYFTQIFAQ